jgi:hypothetical protein
MKTILIILICFAALDFSFPEPKPLVAAQIQNNYVASLLEYQGTPYAPYGETGGISCSTLIRRALPELTALMKMPVIQ